MMQVRILKMNISQKLRQYIYFEFNKKEKNMIYFFVCKYQLLKNNIKTIIKHLTL